ncbi:uncharacterized protein ALTATR162_LOCUS611 [Alternaria atra]|uniref:Uncharacterized protein n=1 Tax=Alternaria atra TaxID=119953 RepID=A0A8J2MV51_9PLEO|nr:uncharacterized protein ALTATR162_LOCUS611 [Alternaria atra]CAG5140005.1 unnamed protein product [Alternaria atra]
MRQQEDAVDIWRMPRRRLIRYEEPVHRDVVPSSTASSRPGWCTSKPPTPGPKPKAPLPKAPEHSAQSNIHATKDTTTIPEGRLPTRGDFGQLQSISVGESTASAKSSSATKAANSAAEDKKDLPNREAHLLYGDEFILPYPSIESFEERFNYSFHPSSTLKLPSSTPLRLPRESAPAHRPLHDKDTDASAHLSARMESLWRQTCSDKELNKPPTTAKQRGQSSSDYSKMLSEKTKAYAGMQEKARQLYSTTSQKARDAQKRVVTSSAKEVTPALLNPTVQNISAQTASKVTHRRVEEDPRRASPLIASGRLPTQYTTEKTTSAQPISNTKREKWFAVDKPKTPQGDEPREEFVELDLESDEEGWEKVDGDDEWEVIDDPRVEMERIANLQNKA